MGKAIWSFEWGYGTARIGREAVSRGECA